METRIAKKSRFRIDKLEVRFAPIAFAYASTYAFVSGRVGASASRNCLGPCVSGGHFWGLRWQHFGGSCLLVGALLGRRVGPRCVERAAPAEEHKQSCGGSRRKGHEDLMTLPPSLQGCATQADPARRGRVGPSWSGRSRAVR